jgi:flagellar basal body rod protein FlgG
MIRGFYTALSGVITSMTRQQVVADNIANVNTVAFKQSRTTQDDFELQVMNTLGPTLGQLGTGSVPTNLRLDISQGPLEVTGIQTDMAIEGDGMFVVRNGGGIAYSRAGNFVADANRMLTTEQGYPVLDTAGRTITVPNVFTVGSDGTIVETGQRIALVGWPPGGVTRLGENLLSAGGQLAPATGSIRQRTLERSNTDMAMAMTELIQFQRNFQMSARAMSLQDNSIGDVTQLGRLR